MPTSRGRRAGPGLDDITSQYSLDQPLVLTLFKGYLECHSTILTTPPYCIMWVYRLHVGALICVTSANKLRSICLYWKCQWVNCSVAHIGSMSCRKSPTDGSASVPSRRRISGYAEFWPAAENPPKTPPNFRKSPSRRKNPANIRLKSHNRVYTRIAQSDLHICPKSFRAKLWVANATQLQPVSRETS